MNNIVFSIKKDEEIISSISNFCKQNNIKYGWINAIGAVKSATLSSYNLETKKYNKKTLTGQYELVALSGNIGTFEDKPVLHLHASLADQNMDSFGGHLEKGTVSATCEVFITKIEEKIERKYDEKTGLNLIHPVKYSQSE